MADVLAWNCGVRGNCWPDADRAVKPLPNQLTRMDICDYHTGDYGFDGSPFSFAISHAAKGVFKQKDSQSLGDAIKEAGGMAGSGF